MYCPWGESNKSSSTHWVIVWSMCNFIICKFTSNISLVVQRFHAFSVGGRSGLQRDQSSILKPHCCKVAGCDFRYWTGDTNLQFHPPKSGVCHSINPAPVRRCVLLDGWWCCQTTLPDPTSSSSTTQTKVRFTPPTAQLLVACFQSNKAICVTSQAMFTSSRPDPDFQRSSGTKTWRRLVETVDHRYVSMYTICPYLPNEKNFFIPWRDQ